MTIQNQRIQLGAQVAARREPADLALTLLEGGRLAPWQLFHARARLRRWHATLPDILKKNGWVDEETLLKTQAECIGTRVADLDRVPPDPRLAGLLDPGLCLRHGVFPWVSRGNQVVLATAHPDRLVSLRAALPPHLRASPVAVAPRAEIEKQIVRHHGEALTSRAEARPDSLHSCRNWHRPTWPGKIAVFLLVFVAVLALTVGFPATSGVLSFLAVGSLFLVALTKAFAFLALRTDPPPRLPPELTPDTRLPRISVIVPLFREAEIAEALISRLTRLSYPKALLEVLLVLEEDDHLTQETLARTRLPRWMRVVEVPRGNGPTTKPRALNYAFNYCQGDIVGIWDAEDAPAPDQLEQVARYFANAPRDVACLQGVLDYYNPWTNWLSRAFTIEYAMWFRVILPGLSKLGFAIPLGGTTLFLRREVVEEIGGWDAHNVTEDADLGIRLARFGYRTELIPTVTQEEANCRLLPWIRQRSRWLKGYILTYLVAMRRPSRLWREVGARKFLGLQVVFLCSVTQFVLAPVLWSFWLVLFGGPHPLTEWLSSAEVAGLTICFVAVGLIDATIALTAISGQGRARLAPWILTMPFYFTLASLAAYKALVELVFSPFYWDKTTHGTTTEGQSAQHSGVGVLFQAGDEGL